MIRIHRPDRPIASRRLPALHRLKQHCDDARSRSLSVLLCFCVFFTARMIVFCTLVPAEPRTHAILRWWWWCGGFTHRVSVFWVAKNYNSAVRQRCESQNIRIVVFNQQTMEDQQMLHTLPYCSCARTNQHRPIHSRCICKIATHSHLGFLVGCCR